MTDARDDSLRPSGDNLRPSGGSPRPSGGGGDHFGGDHFDELDAVRRFPSEHEWLDQPMPELSEGEVGEGEVAEGAFVDRVLAALDEERELDAQLAELDRELPPELLQHFQAPEPGADFVERTVSRLAEDRRQRWQAMLARHVAPEPSPEFVSRTLAALRGDEGAARRGDDLSSDTRSKAGGRSTPDQEALDARGGASAPSLQPGPFARILPFLLAAAAIALMLTQYTTDDRDRPLELRLAHRAPQIAAYADATTPLAAVFAQVHLEDEPYSMLDAPVDGLWLASAMEAGR